MLARCATESETRPVHSLPVAADEDEGAGSGDDSDGDDSGSVEAYREVRVPLYPRKRPRDIVLDRRPTRGELEDRAGKRQRCEGEPAAPGPAPAVALLPPRVLSSHAAATCTSEDPESHGDDVHRLQRALEDKTEEASQAAAMNEALFSQVSELRARFNARLLQAEAAHREEVAVMRAQHAVEMQVLATARAGSS